MRKHPNSAQQFAPVFLARLGLGNTVELEYPDATDAKHGFDGARFYTTPPCYPLMVISTVNDWRVLPNRVINNADEWREYRRLFLGARYWRYESGPADPMTDSVVAMQARIERNQANDND